MFDAAGIRLTIGTRLGTRHRRSAGYGHGRCSLRRRHRLRANAQRVIFVDTSFWAATTSRRDGHHDEAVLLLERHARDPLLTSNHVVGETWSFLRRRHGHRQAVAFLDRVGRTLRLEVVHASREVEAEALFWLRRHDEREYSFVDATSFALMRVRRIVGALAFDGDFSAAGFTELRA